jgi:hypothetical protein
MYLCVYDLSSPLHIISLYTLFFHRAVQDTFYIIQEFFHLLFQKQNLYIIHKSFPTTFNPSGHDIFFLRFSSFDTSLELSERVGERG